MEQDIDGVSVDAKANDVENVAGTPSLTADTANGCESGKEYDSSLILSLHNAFFYRFWFAGFLKGTGGELTCLYPCLPADARARYS